MSSSSIVYHDTFWVSLIPFFCLKEIELIIQQKSYNIRYKYSVLLRVISDAKIFRETESSITGSPKPIVINPTLFAWHLNLHQH